MLLPARLNGEDPAGLRGDVAAALGEDGSGWTFCPCAGLDASSSAADGGSTMAGMNPTLTLSWPSRRSKPTDPHQWAA